MNESEQLNKQIKKNNILKKELKKLKKQVKTLEYIKYCLADKNINLKRKVSRLQHNNWELSKLLKCKINEINKEDL